jgi:hypothetical protein
MCSDAHSSDGQNIISGQPVGKLNSNWETVINTTVGQIGRSFLARCNEHKKTFRNNSHISKIAQHLVEQAHNFSTIHNTMQVLHYQKKSAHLNTV